MAESVVSWLIFLVLVLQCKARLEVWEELPGDTFLKFYLFNVTNPDEFEAGTAKPSLQQVGPYVFREKSHKFDITQNETVVSYRQMKTYSFEPELSRNEHGDQVNEDDSINIINIPLLSFAKNLAEVLYVGPNMFRSLVKAHEKLVKRNVRVGDLFYYGYDAAVYLKVFDVLLPGEPIPPQFEGGRFGLFKDRNGTDDGIVAVGSGKTPEYPYGHIKSWKKSEKLEWWNGTECNKFNGTIDGTGFDKIDLQHYHLYVFVPDTCRSLKYTYEDETAAYGGQNQIVGLKYKFDQHMLQSPSEYPDNECFCNQPGFENKNCLRTGAMDISPCRNAPLALTYPHFLDADPYYLDKVQGGLEPIREQHESFMIVEPKTGAILKDVKKFQLNVRMKPLPALTYLKTIPNMLFPVLWTEKVYTLDEASLDLLGKELSSINDNDNLRLIPWRAQGKNSVGKRMPNHSGKISTSWSWLALLLTAVLAPSLFSYRK